MMDLSPKRSELEPIEVASRDEIQASQLQRMKWSLRYALENVPMYRQRFDDTGVHPDDPKSLSDLALFPSRVKMDMHGHYPFGMFAVPREQIICIHASSATTGKPTVVGYTRNDLDLFDDMASANCIGLNVPVGGRNSWRRAVDQRHTCGRHTWFGGPTAGKGRSWN